MTILHDLPSVDGVPLLTAPAIDGRCSGGIVFRVGQADETLPTRGITHLVEHLALHFADIGSVHANGHTSANDTHFHMTGTVEEVVEFLTKVTSSLRDLPLERLEIEKSILRTEESGRSRGAASALAIERYGSRGYGLSAYDELGLARLTADDVMAWARTWFTRGNAVAWITHPDVPTGLSFALPEGDRRPMPAVTSALRATPAWISGPDGGVAQEAIVRRSTAGSIYARVLEQTLMRELRREDGLSYSASASYGRRDNDFASLWASADALPEKQDALVGGFIDALAKVRYGSIRPSDLEVARREWTERLSHPEAVSYRLPSEALDLVSGGRPSSLPELLAEIEAVDVEAVVAIATEAQSTALIQVPTGDLDWAGYVEAPFESDRLVRGTSAPYLGREDSSVVVGDDGISFATPSGGVTVLWPDATAVLAFPDGARRIIGADGFQVGVEPTLVRDGARMAGLVDAHVDPALVIAMPARDPGRLPQPPAPGSEGYQPRPPRRWAKWVFWPLLVWTVLFSLAWFTDTPTAENTSSDDTWGVWIGGLVFMLVVFLVPLWFLGRAAGYFRRRKAG